MNEKERTIAHMADKQYDKNFLEVLETLLLIAESTMDVTLVIKAIKRLITVIRKPQ